jgi:predicted exporter
MPRKWLSWLQETIGRKTWGVILLWVVVFSLPGWFRLSGNDDIRLLISKPEALLHQEERIRALTGMGNDSQFYLVEGATPEAVLAREEKLVEALQQQVAKGAVGGLQSLSTFVPSMERQKENRRLWEKAVFADADRLTQLLADLRDGIADSLVEEFKNSDKQWMTVERWMEEPFSTPFRHLWLGKVETHFASIVLLQGVSRLSSLEAVATPLEGVTFVDKAGSVSRLFRDYRLWGGGWFLAALCLVYGVLLIRYGLKQAFFVLLPTIAAAVLTLGFLGLASVSLTFFHTMGMMLVLGVGIN